MYNLVMEFRILNSKTTFKAQFPVSNQMASIFSLKTLARFYITDFIVDDEADVTIISMQMIPMGDNE